MAPINFLAPDEGYHALAEFVMAGMRFTQAQSNLHLLGYTITEAQYKAFSEVIDEMVVLDIGRRKLDIL